MKIGIISIPGFKQGNRRVSGIELTQRALEEIYKSHPLVEVYDPIKWKEDMKSMAAYLKREGCTHVIINGFSLGGGFGAQWLTRELLEVGIKIPLQLLCDPVDRSKIVPRSFLTIPLMARSMTRWGEVEIEDAVEEVYGIRQANDRPRAHPIDWRGRKYELPKYHEVAVSGKKERAHHNNLDECDEWMELVKTRTAATIKRLL